MFFFSLLVFYLFIFTFEEVVTVVILVLWFDKLKTRPNFLTTQQKDFSIAAMMALVLSNQVMLFSIGNQERPENQH